MTGEETRPRARRVTSADVARASGFSRTTVSYVLNDTPNQTIPERTRERIRAVAAALGYTPSAAATALRRGHSNVVLVVKDSALSGYITEPFISAIATTLREAGHTPLTTDFESEAALASLARELRPYGVIVLTPVTSTLGGMLTEMGVPRQYFSAIGANPGDTGERPWEEAVGELQAVHLAEGGASSLIYALPPADSARHPLALARARGARRACGERGVTYAAQIAVPPDRAGATGLLARTLATGGAGLTGVAAFDDGVAVTVLAAAHDLHVDVPGHLRVIGADDTPFAAMTSPALTTVRVDAARSGARVAQQFLGVASGEEANAVNRASLSIVRRQTS